MSVELYSEGRVVGYSAYEQYVKQALAIDPDSEPATERQWLASSLAMGSSMLLRLPQDTSHDDDATWVYEATLPSNTNICAANTIIGSYFDGDAHVTTAPWADRVTDYGKLISNTSSSSPSGTVSSTGTVPLSSSYTWSDTEKEKLTDYLKIIDGIFIQPGTWSTWSGTSPYKDFTPDLSGYGRIRLIIRGKINNNIFILLTGFSISTVVYGESGLDGAVDTPSPQDGDFLGPGQFPWANKIIFSMPTSYSAYFNSGKYVRKVPTSGTKLEVDDTAVIDMKTTQPETYYESNYQSSRVAITVSEYATLGDGAAVLTIYQKPAVNSSTYSYPPAIWGTYVDSTGTNYLNPLDVVAPGTVKMFDNADEDQLQDYQDTFPGTFGVNKTEEGMLQVLDEDGNLVSAAEVSTQSLTYNNYVSGDTKAKGVVTTTGTKKELSLSMGSGGGTASQYTISSPPSNNISPSTSNVYWAILLEALANNKNIDILGDYMKAVKTGLANGNYIQFPRDKDGTSSSDGTGLRLYISASEPSSANVPIGSIGIGWE